MEIGHVATHYPLEVRSIEENDDKFGYIKDSNRRLYAGISIHCQFQHILTIYEEGSKNTRNSLFILRILHPYFLPKVRTPFKRSLVAAKTIV